MHSKDTVWQCGAGNPKNDDALREEVDRMVEIKDTHCAIRIEDEFHPWHTSNHHPEGTTSVTMTTESQLSRFIRLSLYLVRTSL